MMDPATPESAVSSPIAYSPPSPDPLLLHDDDDTSPPNSPPRRPAAGTDAEAVPPESSDEPIRELIWGTTIEVRAASESVRHFIATFRDPAASDADPPLYVAMVDQVPLDGVLPTINLNAEHVYLHDGKLYSQLVSFPEEMVPLFINGFTQFLRERRPAASDGRDGLQVNVRPFKLRYTKPMRDLNPDDIDKLVSIKGMIIRTSSIIPDLTEAYFRCGNCQAEKLVPVLVDKPVEEPRVCERCGGRGTWRLVHNRCRFSDKQFVKLQETPDMIPEGETPHTVSLYCYADLVDAARPGDRLEVTGIFKAAPIRTSAIHRQLKSIYKTYLDVLHLRKLDDALGGVQARADEPHDQHAKVDEYFRSISQRPNIYEILAQSLAPSVWEMDDVKKGILCLLFGGADKNQLSSGLTRFRGEINVLLCGDPGTSKSQLLQYVHKIAPRGIYTSGKGSSAVGLTAYIARDPDTREAVLESGALVLSDRGVCCIDEFDKMSDHTRSILHEAMEQQTVSIAKAGIICTLNARTSILASANPRESRYNPQLSVVDNIMLPPTLLSRFDLIYLVLDKPDAQTDRRLATHIISLYYAEPERTLPEVLDKSTLTAYISYAKQRVHPRISDSALEAMVEGYVEMRRAGEGRHTISATPRQLESLVRLAEAHARMRLAAIVEQHDVDEAIRLVKSALQQAAMDPNTGTIDMDLISTGFSASSRAKVDDLKRAVKGIVAQRVDILSWRFDVLLKALSEQSSLVITPTELKRVLKQLVDEDFIVLGGDVRNPFIQRI